MPAHTLGFHHEHSRPDRDQFITVNTNNIIPGKVYILHLFAA